LDAGRQKLSELARVPEHQRHRDFLRQCESTELQSSIVEFELERVRFMLKAYFLARLNKLQKFASWFTRRPEGQLIMNMPATMLQEERDFVANYCESSEHHDVSVALSALDPFVHSLDDGEKNMIVEPDMDTPVFVKIRKDVGEVNLIDNVSYPFVKNDVFLIRYQFVKHLLQRGIIDLI
jgi:GINS complex subunit 4